MSEAPAVPDAHLLDNAVRAALAGPHAHFAETVGRAARVPDGWETVGGKRGVQLVDTGPRVEAAPEAERLGPDDVREILDLVARTRPGSFRARTVELGTYPGIRNRGRLIAMAGERSEMGVPRAGGWGRLRLPGWTEISAVCTAPAYRGRGLAPRLVCAVAAGIRGRGETSLPHGAAANTGAIRPYESIGFTLRRRTTILQLRSPGTAPGTDPGGRPL